MAKEYRIVSRLDNSQFARDAQRLAAMLEGVEKRATAAVRDRERSQDRANKQQIIGLNQLQAAGLKLQDELRKAAEKKAEADKKAAEKRAEAERKAVESQLIGLDTLRYSGLKRQDDLRKAAEKKAEADKKAAEKAAAADRKAVESRMVGLDALRASGLKLQDDLRKAEEERAKESARLQKNLMNFASGAVLSGLAAVAAHYAKIREEAMGAADATNRMLVGLRERAGVQGKTSPDLADVKDLAGIMRYSGMTQEQAGEFATDWENAVGVATGAFEQTGGKVGFSADEAAGMRNEVARLIVRRKMDPRMVSELAGVLGTTRRIKSPEQLVGTIGAMSQIASEGVGSTDQLLAAARELMAKTVQEGGEGFVGTPEELQALVSTMSKFSSSPEEAATRVDQLRNVLLGGAAKFRMGKGMDQPMAEWFRTLGVTPDMTTAEPILDRVIADIKKNAGPNVRNYLMHQGVMAEGASDLLMSLSQGTNYELFKAQMAKARQLNEGGAEYRSNAAFPTSPAGRPLFSAAAADITNLAEGSRAKALRDAMQAEAASPEWRNYRKGWFSMLEANVAGVAEGNVNVGGFFGGDSTEKAGYDAILRQRALQRLAREAKAAGVSEDVLRRASITATRTDSILGGRLGGETEAANLLVNAMRERGVSPGGSDVAGASLRYLEENTAGLKDMAVQLKRLNDREEKKAAPLGPARAPVGTRGVP